MKRQFMTTSLIGYPRIGAKRELKFAIEKFFKKELSESELETVAKTQRQLNWQTQFAAGIDFIPSNDFSFYDTTLDTTFALNIVPERYQALAISPLEKYFAAARGHQSEAGDVKALAIKKWFNTNYHHPFHRARKRNVHDVGGAARCRHPESGGDRRGGQAGF